MAGKHAAPWSIWTEPKHTTEVPVIGPDGFMTTLILPATQEVGRFTPPDSKGDAWDINGRTV